MAEPVDALDLDDSADIESDGRGKDGAWTIVKNVGKMEGLLAIGRKSRDIDLEGGDAADEEGDGGGDGGDAQSHSLAIDLGDDVGDEEDDPADEQTAVHPHERGAEGERLHAKEVHHSRDDAARASEGKQPALPVEFMVVEKRHKARRKEMQRYRFFFKRIMFFEIKCYRRKINIVSLQENMKKTYHILLLMIMVTSWGEVWGQKPQTGQRVALVENRGQWDERVRYRAGMRRAALFAEADGITLAVREEAAKGALGHHAMGHKMHAYRMHFVGADSGVRIEGEERDETYNNYYIGNDPGRWATRVPQYQTVQYSGLYAGIDLRLYAATEAMKYDIVVHPGADARQIAIRYEGTDGIRLRDSDLVISTSVEEIVEQRPYAYQIDGTDTTVVASRYELEESTVRIVLGEYDTSREVVIDPILVFSTYTGSTADNWGTTATYDSYKNTYTSGLVFEIGYPTSLGAYDGTYNGNADIGIFKFDTAGGERLYATYLGGQQADMPHSMYVNTFDELIIFGTTGSDNFPTTEGAYCRTFKGGSELAYLCFYNSEYYRDIYYPEGSDLFVSRFKSDGTALMASTYIGGSGNDGLNYRRRYNDLPITIMQGNDSLYYNYGDGARGEIITDDLNNVYLGSTTMSDDFPTTTGAVQPQSGGEQDGVLLKIDHNLRTLLWSTYLGGGRDDAVYSIDCDKDYNVLACGGSNSTDLTTTAGAMQRNYGGGSADGFIVKVSYNGDELMRSTYFGSSSYDQCYFVRCGKDDDVYLFGQTKAQGNTMIYNAGYGVEGSGMLLARLTGDLGQRRWSTVFGTAIGRPNLSPTAFAADICGRVYAAGWGRDFVGYNGMGWRTAGTWNMTTTAGAYQNSTDGQDFYIMTMDAEATRLDYATFFGELHEEESDGGSDHVDGGTSRFDRLATLYQSVCASCGGHDHFPTTGNAWSRTNNSGNCNNAIFRFNVHDDFPVAEFVTPPVGCAPYTIDFHNTGRGDEYVWDFGDGSTSTEKSPRHTYAESGEYRVLLVASMAQGCATNDSSEVTVRVLGNGHKSSAMTACDGAMTQIGPEPRLGCQYRWIEGRVSDSTIANPYVDEPGEYVLRISVDNGRCDELDTIMVRYNKLIDTVEVRQPTCHGSSDGYVVAHASRTNVGERLHYEWDGLAGDSTLRGQRGDGRRHTLRVWDSLCSEEYTFELQDPESATIDKEANTQLCHDCEGHIVLHAHDSQGRRYRYLWGDGDTASRREGLCEGTYTVTIADDHNCTYEDTTVLVVQHTLDDISVWADDTILFTGQETQLHASEIEGVRYQWTPTSDLDSPTTPHPTARPTGTTTYSVTLTDTAGCSATGQVTIRCTDIGCGETNIFIPNAFTPNGDGQNDELCVRGEYITQFSIAIFDRWGEKVYESEQQEGCWDGRHHGVMCQAGVYYYTCRISCEDGVQRTLKGDITLIR